MFAGTTNWWEERKVNKIESPETKVDSVEPVQV